MQTVYSRCNNIFDATYVQFIIKSAPHSISPRYLPCIAHQTEKGGAFGFTKILYFYYVEKTTLLPL